MHGSLTEVDYTVLEETEDHTRTARTVRILDEELIELLHRS